MRGQYGGTNTSELPLHVGRLDGEARPKRFGTREADPSAAWIADRLGDRVTRGLLVLGLGLLIAFSAAGYARAASGHAPDPAPQAAPAAAPTAAAPDPSPQAASSPRTQSSSVSNTSAGGGSSGSAVAAPVQSGGSVVVAPTPRTTQIQPGAGRSAISTPPALQKSAPHPQVRVERVRLSSVVSPPRAVLGALVARLRSVLQLPSGAAGLPRDGTLLLFSALGLGVLVIASLSLLRLVARLGGES